MQDIGHFFMRVAGVAFLHVAKTLARGVFGELGRLFEVDCLTVKLSSLILRFRASGFPGRHSTLQTPTKKLLRSECFEIFNVLFSWCSRCFVKIEHLLVTFVHVGSLPLRHGANFDIARATLSALCACQIALVVAPCKFCRCFEILCKEVLGAL